MRAEAMSEQRWEEKPNRERHSLGDVGWGSLRQGDGSPSWGAVLLLCGAVWGLFVVACFLPAIVGSGFLIEGERLELEALLFGWMPPLTIAWSANLLLLA